MCRLFVVFMCQIVLCTVRLLQHVVIFPPDLHTNGGSLFHILYNILFRATYCCQIFD